MVNLGSLPCKKDVGVSKISYHIMKKQHFNLLSCHKILPHESWDQFSVFSQTIHTKISLKPCGRGKSVAKCMLQEVNLDVVIANGCSKPVCKDVKSLFFLQIYVAMNFLTEA